ncbi:MAG: DNA polymerase III subunit delta' [Armatimonadaceae bacterium]
MSLRQIIGQETAVATLRRALASDAVPQAYLFVGPEGTGKTATALAFAQTISCKTPTPDGDACGTCANCTRIAAGQHPDVVPIAPDGENTRIWQLWSRPGHPPGALENLPYQPVAAPKRFYIIEKAETLNEESANSLLKALEEPPRYVQFVLCAPSLTAVLPTILSRCQIVRFGPAPLEAIAKGLQERLSLDEGEARSLAAFAQGAPGRAFRLSETPELREQRESLLALANRIARSPGIASFRLAEDLRNIAKPPKAKKGDDSDDGERTTRGEMTRALDVLTTFFSDLLSLSLRGDDAPIVHTDRRAELIEAAGRYRREQLVENLETLFTFRQYLLRNANAQIATEAMMLRLVPKKAAAKPGAGDKVSA